MPSEVWCVFFWCCSCVGIDSKMPAILISFLSSNCSETNYLSPQCFFVWLRGSPRLPQRYWLNNRATNKTHPVPNKQSRLLSFTQIKNTSLQLFFFLQSSCYSRCLKTWARGREIEGEHHQLSFLCEHKVFPKTRRAEGVRVCPGVLVVSVCRGGLLNLARSSPKRSAQTGQRSELSELELQNIEKELKRKKKKKKKRSSNRLWYCLYVIYSCMIISKRCHPLDIDKWRCM